MLCGDISSQFRGVGGVFRRLFAFTPCTLVPCDLIKTAFTRCQNSGPHHVAAGFVSRCVVVVWGGGGGGAGGGVTREVSSAARDIATAVCQ